MTFLNLFFLMFFCLLDHGVVNEGEQAEDSGADGGQSDILTLSCCPPGGRAAAEPMQRRPAGGPLRSALYDRPCWL